MIADISPATHRELYRDWQAALDVCRSIPDADPPAAVAFHMYWRQRRAGWFRRSRPFGRKQALAVKSFFATQDLSRCSLTLWSDAELVSNRWLRPFAARMAFRTYQPEIEARGTALEGRPDLYDQHDRRVWRDGDLFRILALHNYGGVYVDSDVVLLRNLGPLLDREFIYQWADQEGVYNGAVMHLQRGGRFARELIAGVLALKAGNFCWGRDNLGRAVKAGCPITVFPGAFFDADWQAGSRFKPFKRTASRANLPDGAFAWHWHNQWDEPIETGSQFELLERQIDRCLVMRGLIDQAAVEAVR